MLRLMFEDTRYRIICAFSTDKSIIDSAAHRWLSAMDDEIGFTGFANSRSYKLYGVSVSARIIAFLLRPIWWFRGY